ncbi:hypothetical protein ACAW74_23795 [Fibrella sp. WM1]|uniref:hypothetical protein n=1 Tax=Fibrella musci TaxID=3242485 RepID=UPI003520D88E
MFVPTKLQTQRLFALHDFVREQFTKMDWYKLAYLTDSLDLIEDHPRLLRSLDFDDDDYDGNSLQVLLKLISLNPQHLDTLDEYIADRKTRAAQPTIRQAELVAREVVTDFVSTHRRSIPERVIRFVPDVFQIPDKAVETNVLSVMMPFEGRFAGTYQAIRNVCERLGIVCKRADDIWENSILIQDVFDLIFTSHAVITDFTDRNPNVFYETGVAHTLGKIVIPITQSVADIPFDLRHHRALTYLPNQEGLLKLETDLEKKLKTVFT